MAKKKYYKELNRIEQENINKKNTATFKKFFMIFISIFVIGIVSKTLQNDTFYTIKIGDLILKNGIDMMDHFSIGAGLSYTYPHWLYDVIIYVIFHFFGYTGLYISSIIILICLVLLVFKINITLCNNYAMAAFATILCALSVGGFITTRAQSVTYLLFALQILFIESFLKNGKKKYLGGLLVISLIICNIHVAVWPFYFIIYLPYLAEYLISFIYEKWKKKHKAIPFLEKKIIFDKNDNIKYLFLTMIISSVTGLLTPIGSTPYTYLIKTMMGNSQKYIQEHQMMSWKNSPFTIIIIAETVFLFLTSKAKLRDLFMICGLVLMSIVSVRHIALLGLIGTIFFGRTFTIFLEYYKFDIDSKIISFFTKKKVLISALAIVVIFCTVMLNIQLRKEFVDHTIYPVEAVKYIKENINVSEMRIFNEYNYGSYLLLNDIPVFIDSRADLYTKQFSGFDYDVFDDYESLEGTWPEKFEFYGITHVILCKGENSTYEVLLTHPDYNKIYEDEYFIIFEKGSNHHLSLTINS